MVKNLQYCKSGRQKNLEEIKREDRERKQLEKDYGKYCDRKKHKLRQLWYENELKHAKSFFQISTHAQFKV